MKTKVVVLIGLLFFTSCNTILNANALPQNQVNQNRVWVVLHEDASPYSSWAKKLTSSLMTIEVENSLFEALDENGYTIEDIKEMAIILGLKFDTLLKQIIASNYNIKLIAFLANSKNKVAVNQVFSSYPEDKVYEEIIKIVEENDSKEKAENLEIQAQNEHFEEQYESFALNNLQKETTIEDAIDIPNKNISALVEDKEESLEEKQKEINFETPIVNTQGPEIIEKTVFVTAWEQPKEEIKEPEFDTTRYYDALNSMQQITTKDSLKEKVVDNSYLYIAVITVSFIIISTAVFLIIKAKQFAQEKNKAYEKPSCSDIEETRKEIVSQFGGESPF